MDINNYVLVNKKILKFVGLYPISISRYCVCVFFMFLIIIPQVQQIYQNRDDFGIILETSSVLLTILLAISKSFVWILNKNMMEPFIDFMFHDYWKIATKHYFFEFMDKNATYALKVTKGYIFLICNALLFFFSLPLIEIIINMIKGNIGDNNKHFPFPGVYPISFYNFPMYEITYISQMLATINCALIILATDTLIAIALFHTCGHLQMLQYNLNLLGSNLVNYSKNIEKERNKLEYIKRQLSNIIQHHQLILRFCDNMENMFNPIMLLQTLASSLIVCLVGFQVSSTLTEKYKLIEYFSYLLMALFQLLLFCFPGDLLIYQSSMITKAAYSTMWYGLPTPIKNNIHMIMMRSQKPSYITAGKFCMIHLENFSAVLSTALSYFMLLRSINSEMGNS